MAPRSILGFSKALVPIGDEKYDEAAHQVEADEREDDQEEELERHGIMSRQLAANTKLSKLAPLEHGKYFSSGDGERDAIATATGTSFKCIKA